MGKPYLKELQQFDKTIEWTNSLDVAELSNIFSHFQTPVYVVGSGGSLSACQYAADLFTASGLVAKAMTPLELYYSTPSLKGVNIIFISASGRNTDILFAFKKAVEAEALSITNICMRTSTPLQVLSENYSGCRTFEFAHPAGKDGFLATNSLLSFFILLYRTINDSDQVYIPTIDQAKMKVLTNKINKTTTVHLLYGAFNKSIGIDLESRFSEAGLTSVLTCDYRHFAHGRHHWFDKQKDSVIVAVSNSDDERLCTKTLGLLPDSIPTLRIDAQLKGFIGTIELLVAMMQLTALVGNKVKIDPGKPGVPAYGSKIYHLRYERLVSSPKQKTIEELAVARKLRSDSGYKPTEEERKLWSDHYLSFTRQIAKAKFGALVLDYDGTICSAENRFKGINENLKPLLVNLVRKGFILAFISGRGKSLRMSVDKVFEDYPELKKNILLGFYNGSQVSPLTDLNAPNKNLPLHASLIPIAKWAEKENLKFDISPLQLTFSADNPHKWKLVRSQVLNKVMLSDDHSLGVVESSHSIDIIMKEVVSKNNILKEIKKLSKKLRLTGEALCIGDKGQWPGNDFALLSNKYSLSVGEVSADPETCWNICPAGIRDEKGIEYIMSSMAWKKDHFVLKL